MSLFSDKSNSRKGLHFILSSSKKMSHKYMTLEKSEMMVMSILTRQT